MVERPRTISSEDQMDGGTNLMVDQAFGFDRRTWRLEGTHTWLQDQGIVRRPDTNGNYSRARYPPSPSIVFSKDETDGGTNLMIDQGFRLRPQDVETEWHAYMASSSSSATGIIRQLGTPPPPISLPRSSSPRNSIKLQIRQNSQNINKT